MAKRSKKRPEAPSGGFFALPYNILDSDAWKRCSPPARALLMELCRQHNGLNNGHLHLSRSWLESRGWNRPATVRKLRDELAQNRLILQTRHGGLNNGSHWFALTWLAISNFAELDITSRDYHPGAYLLSPLSKEHKTEKKGWTPHVLDKASARTPHVRGDVSPRTPHVRENPLFDDPPRTPHVHNVYNQYIPASAVALSGLVGSGSAASGRRLLITNGCDQVTDEQEKKMA
ncbi:hypothetical protein SAMN05216428_1174 [Nitrosospira sp. Nsp11]|uniref:hypothetical protein n=1 Tax=Nitrosospira sp. Nsp11 TaxID=1855338 RepID=UPI00090EEA3C|nr:hypothetical protein [Nitrosospira sp. Nsp11]SHM20013.1 hypothetical protein SAMN05216428_1174 [Nitrosospira sp. Nsp11]